MLDNRGSIYISDAFLAIVFVLIIFLSVNTVITMPSYDYSYESHEIRLAQEIMDLLSGKIDFEDQTFLSEISEILKENVNSRESINEVSKLSKDKLNSYDLSNYRFSETNVLNDEVLASSGNYNKANNVHTATRDYGEYSYTLSVW